MRGLELIVAHSEDVDSLGVAEELLGQATEALAGRNPRAGLLYANTDLEHELLVDHISRAWPGLQLIGCTTDGEATSRMGFVEESAALVLFVAERLSFGVGLGRSVSADPVAATQRAVQQARQGLDGREPALCITLPESLTTSAVSILEGLKSALGPGVPVVGGTAGDQWRFGRTRQFCGPEVVSDGVPVLLVGGPLRVATGVASGWEPIGRVATATRCEGNVLLEIDGQPARTFYQYYLGKHQAPSGEYPLTVYERDRPSYIRAPLSYDEETGALNLAGDIPEGARIQLTESNRERIVAASRESVQRALSEFLGEPDALLFFSCAARKMLLGTRTREETALLQDLLPSSVPFCGFYAYGEIGPGEAGAPSSFHNETFVTVLLGVADRG